uniref:Putative secreted peptide n=1 Tax=Anopheles braziliensis TaxID=58242 RepID=A0A2M3ZN71_9DIPT
MAKVTFLPTNVLLLMRAAVLPSSPTYFPQYYQRFSLHDCCISRLLCRCSSIEQSISSSLTHDSPAKLSYL